MISGTPARRLGALAPTATALLAACTSDDDDDDSGGDDMTELRWDLRTPTTTRELGRTPTR